MPDNGSTERQRPADDDARNRIRSNLDETLFVEAGAGTGKTSALIERIVSLVDDGTELRNIAAITFTERAAAELRQRVREHLTLIAKPEHEDRYLEAIGQVDEAAIGTLHSFAQRILTEHAIGAGLPLDFEVMSELASVVDFDERWVAFRSELYSDDDAALEVRLATVLGIEEDHLRQIAKQFNDDWDLLEGAVLPDVAGGLSWDEINERIEQLIEETRKLPEEAAHYGELDKSDDSLYQLIEELVGYAEHLDATQDEAMRMQALLPPDMSPSYLPGDKSPSFKPGKRGTKEVWTEDGKKYIHDCVRKLGETRDSIVADVLDTVLYFFAHRLRDFTLGAAEERRCEGRLSFHDLLVRARALLRDPDRGWRTRERLAGRYERLLIDEFQDTDPIQLDLAVLIASPDPDVGAGTSQEIETRPEQLFFVGDPKQSIYRFRRADIDTYLDACDRFGAGLVRLRTNYRSTPAIIEWVNHVFKPLIEDGVSHNGDFPENDDVRRLTYEPLEAARPQWPSEDPQPGPWVATLSPSSEEEETDGTAATSSAQTWREREAEAVAATITTALRDEWLVAKTPVGSHDAKDAPTEEWQPGRLRDIAILLPTRTRLPEIQRALEAAGIPYRTEKSAPIYRSAEAVAIHHALRAIIDPTDAFSLVAALRSPLYGCGDDDLYEYKAIQKGAFHLYAQAHDGDDEHPVRRAIADLRELRESAHLRSPSETIELLCEGRRVFDSACATERPVDAWRRLRFLIDHARAWGDETGGSLRSYVRWVDRLREQRGGPKESILPETDEDAVRIMTIHAAKGREFPIVILAGMSTKIQYDTGVQVAWAVAPEQLEIQCKKKLRTSKAERLLEAAKRSSQEEKKRLLYVAATRARDHLVVSLHGSEGSETWAAILDPRCGDAPHQVRLEPIPDELDDIPKVAVSDPDLPAFDDWQAELKEVIREASRPVAVSATMLAKLPAGTFTSTPAVEPDQPPERGGAEYDAEDPGDYKELEVDPETPFRRGRHGDALGRAVHGVLQVIDLQTGDGLDKFVAVHAELENIADQTDHIRSRVEDALASPSVQAAARSEHWREIYVGTDIDGRVLEGFVDLLYSDEQGRLVLVDYKVTSTSDGLDRLVERYAAQAGAYHLAISEATGESLDRVVFLFLTPGGYVEQTLEGERLSLAQRHAQDAVASTRANER